MLLVVEMERRIITVTNFKDHVGDQHPCESL